jgi:alkanesulfonate monooxygenase SsuD/methylene tetrahydromethanopterin reductase-like flavin-dependent oxidoreductase (luciferase family)
MDDVDTAGQFSGHEVATGDGAHGTRIGVGLPVAIPGSDPELLLAWAQRAEAGGLSSLNVLDRIAYDSHDPLVTLSAAAAVTTRIELACQVLLAAARGPSAVIAKQLRTLDRLSGGRLTVGVGVGTRPDDYEDGEFHRRGRRLDAVLADLRTDPRSGGDEAGDKAAPATRPRLLVGGGSPKALERAAKLADGWVSGSIGGFNKGAPSVRALWQSHGRPGRPRLVACGYFALGPNAEAEAQRHLEQYYAFLGPAARGLGRTAITGTDQLRDVVAQLSDQGAHELVLHPCAAELDQVDRLVDALA